MLTHCGGESCASNAWFSQGKFILSGCSSPVPEGMAYESSAIYTSSS